MILRDSLRQTLLRVGLICAVAIAALVACGARSGLSYSGLGEGLTNTSVGTDGAAGGRVDPGCSQSGSSVPIYAIDETNMLMRFDPQTAVFSTIGRVDCGPIASAAPSVTPRGSFLEPDGSNDGFLVWRGLTAMPRPSPGTASGTCFVKVPSLWTRA